MSVVKSLMTGYESEHTYSPKPSDLVAVRKATPPVRGRSGTRGRGYLVGQECGKCLAPGDHDIQRHSIDPGSTRITADAHMRIRRGNPPCVARSIFSRDDGAAYFPNAMAAADPTHAADYRANTTTYLQSLTRVQDETLGLCSRCRIAPSSSITRFGPISPVVMNYDCWDHPHATRRGTVRATPTSAHRNHSAWAYPRHHLRGAVEPEGSAAAGTGKPGRRSPSDHPPGACRHRDLPRHAAL